MSPVEGPGVVGDAEEVVTDVEGRVAEGAERGGKDKYQRKSKETDHKGHKGHV